MDCIRKADLYKMISKLRQHWGLEDNEYKLDIINLCQSHGIQVGAVPFENPGLRGMASIGDCFKPDVIILNSYRNKIEQKIDCSHEAVHLAFHRNISCKSFNCFETALPSQDKYLEWQANEGGAELNVPYQTLLPKVKKNFHLLNSYNDIVYFKEELIQEYDVTEAVISYRLESLKYEIEQFIHGVSMKELRILSYNSQLKHGIKIKSLNEIAKEYLSRDFETESCNVCQNTIILRKGDFCPICGKKSFRWGDGRMKYPTKIKVNENSKALRCPICDNEDIMQLGDYCHICGTELVNRCTNIDSYGNGCVSLADGNARYCIYCGAETTFYQNGILKSWEEEQKTITSNKDLNLICNEWGKIINELGGPIRASFRDTVIELAEENCLCVVFTDQSNFIIGSRPTALGDIERFVEKKYGKKIYFKARLKTGDETLQTIYVDSSELRKAIHMDIPITD